ncbi:hypothetical protein [Thiohalobacter thiocyanaticus]|uniref:MSHA biogenesis protein MshK n=1 Tax=Thiohalobacter thiocyanaticus TaxID=585455 RepID=A0A426QJW9_9GAMM|nr:hypothetical protein [Thiohalobacter thiocyanaticus]RRQ22006.1 hypothetical protein D6C00_08625 [Thiohalobacter thiocyanaticus]
MRKAPVKLAALAALLTLGAGLTLPCGAAALADPTAPNPRGQAAGPGGDTGSGLTWTRVTENRREAVINGIRVTEGDRLGGARILRIRHGAVEIETASGRDTLRLQPSRIKQAP